MSAPGLDGTPVKAHRPARTSSHVVTDVAAAEAIIRQEMHSHVYVLEGDPTAFFDHFLSGSVSRSQRPVAEIVASVQSALLKIGTLKSVKRG